MHLEKITISNARRFGENVEIDLGKGANIILAPNGTGKTTVFEAIELALTGKIKRLESPPLCFLREEQNALKVKLEFTGEQFCEINYSKEQEPVLTGHRESIYPKHEAEDVLSLMRLTHLLDQKSNHWFVQQKGKEAGALLNKLAIGKELSKIIESKQKTSRRATIAINEKENELTEAQSMLNHIRTKIEERDKLLVEDSLIPIQELYQSILSIYQKYDPAKQIENINANTIYTLAKEAQELLKIELQKNKDKIVQLSGFEVKIDDYQNNKKKVSDQKKEEQVLQEQKDTLEVTLTSHQKTAANQDQSKKDLEKRLHSLDQIKKQFQELEILKKRLQDFNNRHAEKQTNESDLKDTTQGLINLETNKKQLDQRFQSLSSRENEARKKIGQIDNEKLLIEDWKKYLNTIADINTKLPALQKELDEANKLEETLTDEQRAIEKKLAEEEAQLESLNKAFSSIQSAVSIIAQNLTSEDSDCPVCSANYPNGELLRRANSALEHIDPSIAKQTELVKTTQHQLSKQQQKLIEPKDKKRSLSSSMEELTKESTTTQQKINEQILPHFVLMKTPEEAITRLNDQKDGLEEQLSILAEEKKKLGTQPTQEEINALTLSIKTNNKNINQLKTEQEELSLELRNIQSQIENINKKLESVDQQKNESDITTLESNIEKVINEIHDHQLIKIELDKNFNDLKEKLSSVELDISRLRGKEAEMLTEWQELDFPNEPNINDFKQRIDNLRINTKNIENDDKSIVKFSQETSKWLVARKYSELMDEIKAITGDEDEGQFLETSIKNEEDLTEQVENMMKRKRLLDDLFENLKTERNRLDEYLDAINPLWVSLLKRVVLNPRFAKTTLKNYSSQNKKHADSTLELHGEPMQVMDVASEAQITDLQLTFMLSMASTYSWTPWKALLLDDPTQHHDLVHASSVFDLLRDYIVQQDFQVILSTHDSTQAHFFKRKLQNEGVPVKIWKLIANKGGVRAQLIDY